jgi:endonuclease V-like protein UPF0215 family
VVGIVFRGGLWIEGAMKTKIRVDGLDATEKISDMIRYSAHYPQIRVIMLHGITFAGFNIIDGDEMVERTKRPVIAATKERPDLAKIEKAIRGLESSGERLERIRRAGAPVKVYTRGKNEPIYMHSFGMQLEDAKKIATISATRASIPEPLRVAHLIASMYTQECRAPTQ